MSLLERSRNAKYNEAGFTLIELLVVILVIGVLAAIAVPIFLNQRKQALDAQLKSDMKTVATYMENYKIKHPNDPYPRFAINWWGADGTPYNDSVPADLKLSDKTGVITSDSGSSQMYFGGAGAPTGAGFCIEGQVLNSNFDLTNGNTGTKVRMWYNSLKGGFTNSCSF